MATDTSRSRLMKEFKDINKNPIENIRAAPTEHNILEWHFVIIGTKDSPYENGFYHGIIRFPPQFPFKPPALLMFTPNGRFKTNSRLCFSMSDYHPESWNPMWSVSTILMGLFSFMLEEAPTLGSLSMSDSSRRKLAAESLEFNCKNKTFCELFPDLVELYEQQKIEAAAAAAAAANLITTGASTSLKPSSTTTSAASPAVRKSRPPSLVYVGIAFVVVSLLTWLAIFVAI